MLGSILIVVIGVLFIIVFDIGLRMFHALYNRKCPYCGRRMKYLYKEPRDKYENDIYYFFCPHCGHLENVPSDKLIQEPELW